MKNVTKIIILVLTCIVLALTVRSLFHIITTTAPDFGMIWTSTHDLINHKNPYTNPSLFTINTYPPSTFLVYIPTALIPYKLAQAIFTLLSFLAVPGIVFVSLKILSKNIKNFEFLLLLSLSLLSFPTKFTLGMGQINLIAIFIALCSLYFYKNKKMEISGVLFGVACVFKPIFVMLLLF